MRAIRTEIYFDPSEVNGFEGFSRGREFDEKNPGVAFIWLRSESLIDATQLRNLKAFRPLRSDERSWPGRDDIDGILDLFIRDADEFSFTRIAGRGHAENQRLVEFVLNQEIVMENSPPFSVALKVILDKANTPLWIGTFVGSAAGWGHPVLLFITVPGGIIVVSSASGIGKAMDAGLHKALERLFKRLK